MKIEELILHSESFANIAEYLIDEDLVKIGGKVVKGYGIDADSREANGWVDRNEMAIKLSMQTEEPKNTPWVGAANVKYPVTATACIQFSSRVLPNVIKDNRVVKSRVVGNDNNRHKAERAERTSKHMSWQVTEQMTGWEEDFDKMLTSLPAVGCMFRKTYYDAVKGHNVAERIMPEHCVIHYFAKDMDSAARITHYYELYPNNIEEKKRSGEFLDVNMFSSTESVNEGDNRPGEDDDGPHVFLEQHRWLDLDDDGYQEPYIVTVHKETEQVVRIVARFDKKGVKISNKKVEKITAIQYFVKYPFIPSIDGSIYDVGFGHILAPINKTINQTVNQLLDAGHLSVLQCGFLGKGLQLGRNKSGGDAKFKPGEWKQLNMAGLDITKNIVPLPVNEPSLVLFQLLGFMVQAAKELSSVADVLVGESPGQDVPATTTLALIEQGLKVFSAIYMRIHRSLKQEFSNYFYLNSVFLDDEEVFTVLDDEEAIGKKDYAFGENDIIPVSSAKDITDIQKLIKNQALQSMRGMGLNEQVINKRSLEALEIEDIDELMNVPQPPPNPEIELEKEKAKLARDRLEFEMMKYRTEQIESESRTIKNLADAEAKEEGTQLDIYKTELEKLKGGEDGGNRRERKEVAGAPANSAAVRTG